MFQLGYRTNSLLQKDSFLYKQYDLECMKGYFVSKLQKQIAQHQKSLTRLTTLTDYLY